MTFDLQILVVHTHTYTPITRYGTQSLCAAVSNSMNKTNKKISPSLSRVTLDSCPPNENF